MGAEASLSFRTFVAKQEINGRIEMKLRVVAFGALVLAGLAGKADDVAMLLSSKFPSPSIVEEMQDRSGAVSLADRCLA